jgi:hypothetical protein
VAIELQYLHNILANFATVVVLVLLLLLLLPFFLLLYLHNTLSDDCNVFVLQYLQNTVADLTTVVVALQYIYILYIYYINRFQNVLTRCPTPRIHCGLSSHWPS